MAFLELKKRALAYAIGGVRSAVLKRVTEKQLASYMISKTDIMDQGSWNTLWGTDIISGDDSLDLFTKYRPKDLELLMQKSDLVFACVERIAKAVIEADLEVGEFTDDGWDKMEGTFFDKFLSSPNEQQSYPTFMKQLIYNLMLTGVSYIWKFKSRSGQTNEWWNLPTSYVTPMYNNNNYLIGYRIFQGSSKKPYMARLDEISATGFINPNDPTKYISPITAAKKSEQIDEERANYMMEMLTNLKAPGLVLHQELDWTDEQKNEARKILNDLIGKGKRGSPLFVSGKGSKAEMTAPLKDLDWPGLTMLSESRICAVYGVPPIVLNLRAGIEHATYSNYEQAEKAFYHGTISSIWQTLAAELTRTLILSDFGDELKGVKFWFNTQDVKQLHEDENKLAERATNLYFGGIATLEEARAIVSLPAPKKGDKFLIPMRMMEVTYGTENQINALQTDTNNNNMSHSAEDVQDNEEQSNDQTTNSDKKRQDTEKDDGEGEGTQGKTKKIKKQEGKEKQEGKITYGDEKHGKNGKSNNGKTKKRILQTLQNGRK